MRFSRRLGLALLGALMLGVVIAAAGGAAKPKLSAVGSRHARLQLHGAKSTSGALAQTDPSLLGRTDATPVNVLIKYDYDATASYARRRRRPRGHEPGGDRQDAEGQQGGRRAPTSSTPARSRARSARRSRRPCRTPRSASRSQTAYGGVAATVPANSVADLLKVDGVAAVQQDTLEQPQDDNTPSSSARRPSGRRSAAPIHAGANVVVGVIDTRHLARASDVLEQRSPASGRRPQGLPVRRRQRRRPPRPGVRVQQQADRRVRVHRHVHGQRSAPTRARVLQQHDRRLLAARLRGPRHAHAHDGRRRLCRLGAALRRRARPDQRHRARRARDRVPRLPGAGLLQLRLGRGRRSRRSATAST